MQPFDTAKIEARHRIFLVLWFGFLMSIAIFAALAFFVLEPKSERLENPVMTWTLFAIGSFSAVSSLVVRRKLFEQAVEKQDALLLMRGNIIASALCEVAGVLALLLFLTTPGRAYIYLFGISAIFMLAQFPRRTDLKATSYKSQ